MVNILIGILKGIGILLLAVLGLLLLLLLIIMLGPICYRASGVYREEKEFSAGVSWLGIVLRCRADYSEKRGFLWGIRLFGILIASNDEAFLKKKKEKRLKRAEREKAKAAKPVKPGDQDKAVLKEEEWLSQEDEISEEKLPMQNLNIEQPLMETSEHADKQESVIEQIGTRTELSETKPGLLETKPQQSEAVTETPKSKKKPSVTIKEKYILAKNAVKNLIEKIKAIPARIKNTIGSMKTKMESIKTKIARILEWKEFFLGEKNREGFLHVLKNLKKIAIHILPRKLEGTVEFGVEDPYIMGQILTVLSIFYPLYQDKFTVLPDFEHPGFAGEASLKGRIIPGYLVLRLLILICNREVIRIIKEGRQLIGGKEV